MWCLCVSLHHGEPQCERRMSDGCHDQLRSSGLLCYVRCMSHLDTCQVMLETQPCNLYWTCINVCKRALQVVLLNLQVLTAPAYGVHGGDQPMGAPLSELRLQTCLPLFSGRSDPSRGVDLPANHSCARKHPCCRSLGCCTLCQSSCTTACTPGDTHRESCCANGSCIALLSSCTPAKPCAEPNNLMLQWAICTSLGSFLHSPPTHPVGLPCRTAPAGRSPRQSARQSAAH